MKTTGNPKSLKTLPQEHETVEISANMLFLTATQWRNKCCARIAHRMTRINTPTRVFEY